MMNNGSRGLLIGLWVTLMVMIAFTARQWGLETLRQQAQLDNERLAGQLLGELDKYRRLPALIATRSELKQTLLQQFPPIDSTLCWSNTTRSSGRTPSI